MYKSFTAKNFRCFGDLTIEPLERINLIAGKNNVGKTALLEALWLHHGYHNPELGVRVDVFRGLADIKKAEFLWGLFTEFDSDRAIELSSLDSDNQLRSLRISIQERPTTLVPLHNGEVERGNERELPTVEVSDQETTEAIESEVLFEYTSPAGQPTEAHAAIVEDGIVFQRPRGVKEPSGVFLAARRPHRLKENANRFSDLAIVKKEDEIVRMMKIIEPRLKGLSVQRGMIWGDIEGMERLIPLPLMGDGIGRFLDIVLAISVAQDGILLIDEIENGFHHSIMSQVWKAIDEWAKEYTVQVFATTHSEECIRAAHQAFAASKQYDFALHRLEQVKGAIRAVTFDQETLDAAIEMDAEVR